MHLRVNLHGVIVRNRLGLGGLHRFRDGISVTEVTEPVEYFLKTRGDEGNRCERLVLSSKTTSDLFNHGTINERCAPYVVQDRPRCIKEVGLLVSIPCGISTDVYAGKVSRCSIEEPLSLLTGVKDFHQNV
jgi:hypothetical protein